MMLTTWGQTTVSVHSNVSCLTSTPQSNYLIVQVDVRELDQIFQLGAFAQDDHQLTETVQLPEDGVCEQVILSSWNLKPQQGHGALWTSTVQVGGPVLTCCCLGSV